MSFTCTTAKFAATLDILADMLLNPAFPAESLERLRAQRLVAVQVEAAGEARGDDEQPEQDPAEDSRRDADGGARGRLGLPVPPHRLEDRGRKHGAAVAVDGRGAADTSLQRGSHSEKFGACNGAPGHDTEATGGGR